MSLFRRLILSLALLAGIAPALAQVPAPVPALPDSERRTSYSISGTTCACNVNFALYGDSTDYQNWVEVYLNGVNVAFNDPTFGWAITSPSPGGLTSARPITNAVLTFNAVQTGTVQIVGARRPRRTVQFAENAGVSARNLNQAFTDIIAMQRETWDKTNDVTGRALLSQPGVTLGLLPLPATCVSGYLGFDSTGLTPVCRTGSGGGSVTLPVVNNDVACFDGAAGILKDCGVPFSGFAKIAGGNTFTGAQILDITGTPPNGFQVRTNDGGITAASIAAINYAGTGSGSTGGAFHGECIGGSFAAQTQCKSGWMISGFGGIVHTGVGLSASSPSSMIYTADEDQTPTANGSHIDWFTTPIGTALLNRVNWMTLTNNGVLQIKSTGTIKVGNGTADANSGAIIQGVVASGGVASLISQPNSTTGFNGLHTNNSTGVAGLFAVVNEPSAVGTIFGQTDGNWTEIVSSGASHNGLLFGTLSASVPVVFGTNNTERMRLLTGLAVGLTTDPGGGVVSALNGFLVATAAKTLTLKQGANGAVGTFICTGGGTITISNSNVATSDGIGISMATAGGTITTPPAFKTITGASGFTVLCGATDTSTYNYFIIKNAA